jgi:hypothetical protein
VGAPPSGAAAFLVAGSSLHHDSSSATSRSSAWKRVFVMNMCAPAPGLTPDEKGE